jgi:hypothetical protein
MRFSVLTLLIALPAVAYASDCLSEGGNCQTGMCCPGLSCDDFGFEQVRINTFPPSDAGTEINTGVCLRGWTIPGGHPIKKVRLEKGL